MSKDGILKRIIGNYDECFDRQMFLKCNFVGRFFPIALLLCWLASSWYTVAYGQISVGGENDSSNLPPIGTVRYGNIEVAWVRSPADNRKLFQVAAPTIADRDKTIGDRQPVEVRARTIQALLRLAVTRVRGDVRAKLLEPQSSKIDNSAPKVLVSTLNQRPVAQIKIDASFRPLTIATVTQTDVDFYSQTPEQIVRGWQEILVAEIERVKYLASPQVIRNRLWQAIAILIAAVVLSSLIGLMNWWLGRKYEQLKRRYEAGITVCKLDTAKMQTESVDVRKLDPLDASAATFTRVTNLFKRQKNLQNLLYVYKSLRWFLVWMAIIGWYLTVYIISTRLPVLMRWSGAILSQPLKLLAIWFLIGLSIQIAKNFIHRSTDAWKANSYLTFGESQRKSLRLTTIATALEGFTSVAFILLGTLVTLTLFNISTSSILAGGAVIGLAISFGTQNLVQDVVNGCLILLEDRFAVGDVIIVNGLDGFVEGFNLRITQLRNPEGELITIPNSAIAEVRNLTRLWSRVDFTIEVAYDNDPDKVLEVLEEVAQQMYRSPDWQDKFPAPPEILGIESLSHEGMLVRVWIKTAPLQQWIVGREYRLRVRRAFKQHNIVIGRPQWITYSAKLNRDS